MRYLTTYRKRHLHPPHSLIPLKFESFSGGEISSLRTRVLVYLTLVLTLTHFAATSSVNDWKPRPSVATTRSTQVSSTYSIDMCTIVSANKTAKPHPGKNRYSNAESISVQ